MGKKNQPYGTGECPECGTEFFRKQRMYCSRPCYEKAISRMRTDAHFDENLELAKVGKRRCKICNRVKRVELFHKKKGRKDGRDTRCKACLNKARPKHHDKARDRTYQAKYGITLEEYSAMLDRQGGKCAICGGGTTKRYFNIDHDHATGEMRGLLCSPCNRILGKWRDRPEVADAAAAYLREPPSREVLKDRDWSKYKGLRTGAQQ